MATSPGIASLPPEEVVPEQEEEQLDQQVDYGDKNVNLPEEMQQAGAALITLFMQQDRYVRRQEILDVRKARFFDRSAQYIFWNAQQNMYITGPSRASRKHRLPVGGHLSVTWTCMTFTLPTSKSLRLSCPRTLRA